jgi:methylated-DNA-[protein]-cysteine S-methyltransferase
MDYIWKYDSPLGAITMASDGVSLIGLWFDGQRFFVETLGEFEEKHLPVFDETSRWLDIYFSGKDPGFTPRLGLRGTAFRKDVWDILMGIPFGKTMTYGEIAGIVARKRGVPRMSAQAVGGAVGHNPVSLIVPCHRVIGADGSLTGYAGGLDLKSRLLDMESGQ